MNHSCTSPTEGNPPEGEVPGVVLERVGTSIPTVEIRVRELMMLGSRTPRQPVIEKHVLEL